MAGIISERLALIIDAKTAGAVTELTKAMAATEGQAVAADKAAAANARLSASTDKLAVSEAKLALAQSGAGKGSAEQLAVVAASDKYKLSKAESAVTSDRLAVSEAKAAAEAGRLGGAAQGAGGLLSQMGLAGSGAGAAISAAFITIAPLIAAIGITKVLVDGIKGFEDITGKIRTFKAVAGGSAEEVSVLVGRMEALGVEQQTAAKAVGFLGAAIGQGKSKIADYGVEIVRLKNGDVDLLATMDNVTAAYRASTDATQRDALAKAAYGRGYLALLPVLNATSEQLRQIDAATKARGAIYNQQELNDGKQLAIATAETSRSFKEVEISVAKGLAPALSGALHLVTNIVDGLNKIPHVKLGGQDFGFFDLGTIGGLTKAYRALTGAKADNTAADKEAALAAKENADAQDKLTKSVIDEFNAERSVDSATKSVESSQKSLDKLLRDGAVDQKALTAAKRESALVAREVERALDSETKAQDALTKARKKATELELEQANLNIADAGDRIQAAQERFDALVGSGAASRSELAKAQRDIVQAQIDQAKAGDALGTLKQKGSDSDPAVIAAAEAVQNAHENVTAAQDRQRDSLEKLHTIQAGDPEYAQKVIDARNNLKDAQDNLMAANYRLKASEEALGGALSTTAANIQIVADKLKDFPGYASLIPPGQLPLTITVTPNAGIVPTVTGKGGPTAIGGETGGVGAAIPGIAGRAGGGPVRAGSTYLVGEGGPELLHMGSQAGYIAPTGAGANIEQHFHGYESAHIAAAAARETAWTLLTLPPLAPAYAA